MPYTSTDALNVFLSYASEDGAIAEALASTLRAAFVNEPRSTHRRIGLVGALRQQRDVLAVRAGRTRHRVEEPRRHRRLRGMLEKLMPVTLPPGRLRLATRPNFTGSAPVEKTMEKSDHRHLADYRSATRRAGRSMGQT
jgi:hypothetical protein